MSKHDHSHSHQAPHITPLSTYLKVAGALFALTFLTVAAHAIHHILGPVAPFVAFTIAAIKAFLVMAWFMHLKYESLENKVIFGCGFFFLLLLFGITLTDIISRQLITSVL